MKPFFTNVSATSTAEASTTYLCQKWFFESSYKCGNGRRIEDSFRIRDVHLVSWKVNPYTLNVKHRSVKIFRSPVGSDVRM